MNGQEIEYFYVFNLSDECLSDQMEAGIHRWKAFYQENEKDGNEVHKAGLVRSIATKVIHKGDFP